MLVPVTKYPSSQVHVREVGLTIWHVALLSPLHPGKTHMSTSVEKKMSSLKHKAPDVPPPLHSVNVTFPTSLFPESGESYVFWHVHILVGAAPSGCVQVA